MNRLSNRRRNALLVACGVALVGSATGLASAQATPRLGLVLGIREVTTTGALGSNGGATGGIEWVGLTNNKTFNIDGTFQTVTFNFGTDSVTNFSSGNGVLSTANNLAVFEHLRISNIDGVTRPVNLFIRSISATGLEPLTDFNSATYTVGADRPLFRDPTVSGSTSAFFPARPFASSTVVDVEPDTGVAADPAVKSARMQFRFTTPDPANWGRATTNGSVGPINPIVNIASGSSMTFQVAASFANPDYDYRGFDEGSASTTNNWSDPANWGTRGVPNSNVAPASFDEAPVDPPATARTVNLDISAKVQHLQFQTATSYTIAPADTVTPQTLTITRASTGLNPVLTVEAGNHTIAAPLVFTSEAVLPAPPTPPTPFTTVGNNTLWASAGAALTVSAPTTVTPVLLTNNPAATAQAVLEKRGPGTIEFSGGFTNDLNVFRIFASGGTVRVGGTTNRSIGISTLNGSGRWELAPTDSTLTVGQLLVTGAGNSLRVDPQGTTGAAVVSNLTVNANARLRIDNPGKRAAKVVTLAVNATGQVDLGDDGLVVDYASTETPGTSLALVGGLVATGRGADTWTGNGIISSLLPGTGSAGIGFAEASALGISSFMGEPVDDSAIVVRYTLTGDATLDGTVNFDDLLKLAANYNQPTGMSWIQGDANYDGAVNFDDLLKLAANYNQTVTGSLGGDWALAQAAVPEPTSLLAVSGAGIGLLSRRRRK